MSNELERVERETCPNGPDHVHDAVNDLTCNWSYQHTRAVIAAMTTTPLEWGYGNDMAISPGIDRAGSESEVKEWNDRAAILTREARGEASYPRAFLYARTPAVPAGKWEATQ